MRQGRACSVLVAIVVATTSACGAQAPSRLASASGAPSAEPAVISVVLLHCGMQPVAVEGRLWEAPPTTVDGSPDLPLDATNQPEDWVGQGRADVVGDRMTYTDRGGEVVEFVPDDGTSSGGCA